MIVQVVTLLCVLNAVALSLGADSWKVVQRDYTTIAMSLSFQDEKSGWIAGSTDDAEPLLIHTDDGGKTLNKAIVGDVQDGVLMSIRMADATHGIAGGLSFANLPCGLQTTDGKTWNRIHDGLDILCAVQWCSAPSTEHLVMVGEFSHPLHPAADGIQVTRDGGLSWEIQNWKQNISARYGYFFDADKGYVTGGEWPDNSRSRLKYPVQVNRHLHHDGKSFKFNTKASTAIDGYRGIIASTTDGGKTFKKLIDVTDQGFYFNEISCIDWNHCWVVAEGVNSSGADMAYIYATADGFKTFVQQTIFPHGSLVAVNVIQPTPTTVLGWAAGTDLERKGLNIFEGTFYQTTDGKTWKQFPQVPDFFAMDLSTIDKDYAYSAGLDADTLAELAQFAPSN